MRGCFGVLFQTEEHFRCHSWNNNKKLQFSYTTAISRGTSGESLKEECVTQLQTQKSLIFLQISDFAETSWKSINPTFYQWIKTGALHLGEELGLWGMLGPPCGVRMPWQLSVTSRQTTAVLPDPALPTMTAPRPSQLLVFLRTSSRRVKSQSRPTNGVSAVMPGTSNSSGFSIMSACLNGASLPRRI